jgi:asparagine synthase (glutamine-hydrolysing)
VAAHFSGGMDSTSVALLAREQLQQQGRPLHALSLVYEKLANLKGEEAYINDALDRPGLVPHRLVADEWLDYDAFRDAPLHDEPYSGLFRIGALGALTRAAADAGADTILSGLGADEVLADAPYYIADLLRRGRLAKAWSEALGWSRTRKCSLWRYLDAYGVSPLLPAFWQVGPRTMWRGGFAKSNNLGRWSIPPWVKPEFARRANLRSVVLERVRLEFHEDSSVVRSEALARIRYFATGDWCRYALSAPLGIVDTHPFRDRRVLAFGLGARSRIQPVPGRQKVLLNAAMRDVLPQSIRERRGKEHFNAVYYDGLSRNLPYLENMIQRTECDALELFDKESLLGFLRKSALGVGSMDGTAALNSSLAIIKWLAQLPAWLDQPCAPTRVLAAN